MREYRDRQRSLPQLGQHLAVWEEELLLWETGRRVPIRSWEETPERGTPRPLAPGTEWSDRHGVHVLRSLDPVTAPPSEAVELRLDLGGEALVRLKDEGGATLMEFGTNPMHRRFAPLPNVPFTIEAEAVARRLLGQPVRSPMLSLAELAWFEPNVRALRRRIEAMRQTMEVVAGDDTLARSLYEVARTAIARLRLPTETSKAGERAARGAPAASLWEASFLPVDEPQDMDEVARTSVDEALGVIDEGLTDLRARWPKQGRVLATGHAHIDDAWLWPQAETDRKVHRTFAGMDHLLSAHPDMTFLASSARHYALVEAKDPALFERIRAHVAAGRWEAIGGMLIEPDTNMPSAEAFLRQILHGQRWFEARFGDLHGTAWLPDTFGFTGALPQILRHAGIEAMVTIKVTWNETNRLPDNLFRWVGNDGTEILVHTFDARAHDGYNMRMTPGALMEVWGNHKGADLSDTVIASYGWGDGGGGADPDQVEMVPVLNLMPAIPNVAHGGIQEHLDRLRSELGETVLPTWRGEMYLEYHRATLTTQGRIKQLNRRAERALVAAEAIEALAALAGHEQVPPDPGRAGGGRDKPVQMAGQGHNQEPDRARDWVTLLRNQFHDVLPGSSIREVYEVAEPELEGVVARAEADVIRTLSALAPPGGEPGLAVANLSGSAKARWQVVSSVPPPDGLAPQRHGDAWVVAVDRPLTPMSVAFLASGPSTSRVRVDGRRMENDLVAVTLDDQGRVSSLVDKRCGRELIAKAGEGGAANRLMVHRNDLPHDFDAWDIEAGFDVGAEELSDVEQIEVTAEGPHLAEITVIRRLGASRIVQRLRLWANSARLAFATEIDWHDRRTYLRAAFPVTVLAEQAAIDQAIGVTWRATHDNTSWQKAQFEGCGHRFVHLGETDWGAALLSADKYGFAAKGNVLSLSLIRGPMYPDMLADEGKHTFTYAILPTQGRWWDDDVQAEADLLSDPLRTAPAASGGPDLTPLGWTGASLRLHALKPGPEGSHVLRVSEAAGRRGPFELRVPDGVAVAPVDGLERPVLRGDGLRPFELVSMQLS